MRIINTEFRKHNGVIHAFVFIRKPSVVDGKTLNSLSEENIEVLKEIFNLEIINE